MKKGFVIAAIIGGVHFIVCSAIMIWYFRIRGAVFGDPPLMHFLSHVLLLVNRSGINHGKSAILASFAVNSLIWGSALGSLVCAIQWKLLKPQHREHSLS